MRRYLSWSLRAFSLFRRSLRLSADSLVGSEFGGRWDELSFDSSTVPATETSGKQTEKIQTKAETKVSFFIRLTPAYSFGVEASCLEGDESIFLSFWLKSRFKMRYWANLLSPKILRIVLASSTCTLLYAVKLRL